MMAPRCKYAVIIVCPEWKTELERLKKEQFRYKTRSEMYRFLIQKGLDTQRRGDNIRSTMDMHHEP